MPLELVAALVQFLHCSRLKADRGEGAVLVFLPGWGDITKARNCCLLPLAASCCLLLPCCLLLAACCLLASCLLSFLLPIAASPA